MLNRSSLRRLMRSKTTLVPINAVNRLIAMPRHRVTAKPLMGPVPNKNNANPVIKVVTWASTIVKKALSYPASTANRTGRPCLSSSRMRSKIKILESTPIPIVKIIPAIPGNVSVALSPDNAPNKQRRFKAKAASAITPDIR